MAKTKPLPTNWIAISERVYADPTFIAIRRGAIATFFFLIAWSKHQRTDGRIHKLALLHCGAEEGDIDELLKATLVVPVEDGWLIRSFAKWQTTNAEIEERKAEKSEKRRQAGVASGEARRAKGETPAGADQQDPGGYDELAAERWIEELTAIMDPSVAKTLTPGGMKTMLKPVDPLYWDAVYIHLRNFRGILKTELQKIENGFKLNPPRPYDWSWSTPDNGSRIAAKLKPRYPQTAADLERHSREEDPETTSRIRGLVKRHKTVEQAVGELLKFYDEQAAEGSQHGDEDQDEY